MRGVWHHHDRRRRGPRAHRHHGHSREGSSHGPLEWTWCRAGLAPWTRTGGRARRRLPCGGANRDAGSLPGTARTPLMTSSTDATSVPGACHIVTLAGDAPGEGRRRAGQDTTGHRGRTGDPLLLHPQFLARLTHASSPRVNKNASVRPSRQMRHTSGVEVAYRCAQQVRDVFHQATPAHSRRLAAHLVERLPTCPMPEIAGLGRTLRTWKNAHLASFDTGGASNTPHRSHQQT